MLGVQWASHLRASKSKNSCFLVVTKIVCCRSETGLDMAKQAVRLWLQQKVLVSCQRMQNYFMRGQLLFTKQDVAGIVLVGTEGRIGAIALVLSLLHLMFRDQEPPSRRTVHRLRACVYQGAAKGFLQDFLFGLVRLHSAAETRLAASRVT